MVDPVQIWTGLGSGRGCCLGKTEAATLVLLTQKDT
jgi:hypothetical protein